VQSDTPIIHKSPRRFRLFFVAFLLFTGIAFALYSSQQALKQSQDVRQQAAEEPTNIVCPMVACPEGEATFIDENGCGCDPDYVPPTPIPIVSPIVKPRPSATPTILPSSTPVSILPDLSISAIDVVKTQNDPNKYNITVAVMNQSDVQTDAFSMHLYVNPSTNPPTAKTEAVGNFDHQGLAAGDSVPFTQTDLDETDLSKTTNNIFAWVDKDNAVAESDEDNNTKSTIYRMPLPPPVPVTPDPTPAPSPNPSPIVTPDPSITPIQHNIADICGPNGSRSPDKQVNQDDLNCILNDFYKTAPAGRLSTDLNKDGVVNLMDYAIFVYNYNKLNAQ